MRFLLLLSVFFFVSCSSTQRISQNLYMASCDGLFGGCQGEMQKACPEGYLIIAQKTEWLNEVVRKHIHFQCNELKGRDISSLENLLD